MKILRLSNPHHGWIDITFGLEPECYTITVSDVPNDCLRELAASTALLLSGSTAEIVEMSLEPGYAKCHLHRQADQVEIRLCLPDLADPVFNGTFPLRAFANRLKSELLKLKPQYESETGWTQPFPHRELAGL